MATPFTTSTTNSESSKREFCVIRVVFPIESEDQALAVKKAIREATADIADVACDFRISQGMGAIGR